MGLLTPMITYNVHDRGRKHLGTERNFDLKALAAVINGGAVQERVSQGDMLGYSGHWPRLVFGMATQEGGIVDGKSVATPISIRTTHLSADEDGNITHQAEFLDNEFGRVAQGLYEAKAGGFSSAIDVVVGSSPSRPLDFYGFDFVATPNYSTNRGYRSMLDAVGADPAEFANLGTVALLDAVMAEQADMAGLLGTIADGLQGQLTTALDALERVSRENDELIGKLAALSVSALDSIGASAIAPSRNTKPPSYDRFLELPLVELEELADPKRKAVRMPEDDFRRRYGL